jgi:hypothetical protein
VGLTSVLEAVFNANNTATQQWVTVPLDANGNATVTAQFTTTGQYLNVAAPDLSVNVVTYPVTIGAATQGGTVTVTASVPGEVVTLAGTNNTDLFVTADSVTAMQSGGTNTINANAGSFTLNATGGSDVIYDTTGTNVFNLAPSFSEFVGGPSAAGASTINGAVGGSDLIFAGQGGVDYNGAQATNSEYVGGAGESTVVGATNEIAFSGAGGGAFSIGTGSFDFVGGGGADTITAGSGSASGFIWGNNNENLTLASLAGAGSVPGSSLVALGEDDSINAMNAAGGNTFFVYNQVPPVAGLTTFAGDTTLVGSTAGGDNFALFVDSTSPVAHTITIENWQSSDTMFITNLTNAGGGLSATDANAIAAFDGGNTQSFTLQDGTTVDFIGAKPTTILHV